MTINFSEGEALPIDLLAVVDGMFKETAEELARVIEMVKAGAFQEAQKTAGTVADVKAAFQLVMQERGRVAQLGKYVTGVLGTGTIDFDAARDEIGSRLARLRNAETG